MVLNDILLQCQVHPVHGLKISLTFISADLVQAVPDTEQKKRGIPVPLHPGAVGQAVHPLRQELFDIAATGMVVLACPIVKGDFDIYSSGTLELCLYLSLEIPRAPVLDGSSVAFFPFVLMDHLDGAVFLLYFRQLLLTLRLLCPLLHLLCVAGFCHEHIPKLPDMVHVLVDGKMPVLGSDPAQIAVLLLEFPVPPGLLSGLFPFSDGAVLPVIFRVHGPSGTVHLPLDGSFLLLPIFDRHAPLCQVL